MPTYEYRCNDTGKKFEVTYKTYADFDKAVPVSPFTGSTNVTRLIRPLALKKSQSGRIDRIEAGDPTALAELEDSDPKTLGMTLRQLTDRMDEDLGPEFNEVVERLESGQSPDEVETSMPPLDDGRWIENLGEGIPGTPSYNPDALPPPGHEED